MKILSIILPSRTLALILSEYVLGFLGFLTGLVLLVQGPAIAYLSEESGWARIAVAALSVVIGLFVTNLYAKPRVKSRVALALKLSSVFGLALITQGLLAYLPSGLTLPRAVMLGGGAISFVCIFALRIAYSYIVLSKMGVQDLLFVGFNDVTREIAERVETHPELGLRVAGYLSADAAPIEFSAPHLGNLRDLESIADRFSKPRIVVVSASRDLELPMAALLRMSRNGVLVEEDSSAHENICGRVCSRQLRPNQIIFFNELPSRPGSMALQSVYTNLLALAAILITSPILLATALAVKLTSRGPVLETDFRVGMHGIPFSLHKFRCHYVNRSAETREQLVTPVGKVLKALHLINWPRLFNLLRGEITLVGPQPERPEFANEMRRYFAFYGQRHSIKPGMTGWSQINSITENCRTDLVRNLEYDLYYTKHISLALDAYILLHGIRALLPFARQTP